MSGTPPTKVTWTRNGVIISYNDGVYKQTQNLINRTKTEYQNVLTVDGSIEDAIGTYGCTVENSLGISETASKTIKCMITADIILQFEIEGELDNFKQSVQNIFALYNIVSSTALS